MTTTVPPLKNAAYYFEVGLPSQANMRIFKITPTLAAGDIEVSKDGGAFSNIGTLPSQIGTSGILTVALTATEMNADRVVVRFHDAAGDEWADIIATIHTVTDNQMDDLSTFDETAVLPDSISADGNRPSMNQALLEINRFLQEREVASTTVTVNKEDGTTQVMTLTLDDASNPTTISRAS
jgi:hypothetical protein